MAGQATWDSAGASKNAYITRFMTEKNMAFEARHRSNFGRLSKPMGKEVVQKGNKEIELDVGQSSVIWTKEITTGDEVRFTLEETLAGAPTFGDAPVAEGDYQSYRHMNIILNKYDSPAFKLPEQMSLQRVSETISNPKGRLRSQITSYFGEQYAFDAIEAHLMGASMNLRAPKSIGGRSINNGDVVSPSNFIVAGSGFVSGASGTSAYEAAIAAALANLDPTNADHQASLGLFQDLQRTAEERKVAKVQLNGQEKYVVICDPDIIHRLARVNGALWNAYLSADTRGKDNKAFVGGAVEIEDMIFLPEQRLKLYRPIASDGADITNGFHYGAASDVYDRRRMANPNSKIALAMFLGDGAILEGTNGAIEITEKKGDHGKGYSIAGHVLRSMMRADWRPKDGRDDDVLNQSSLTIAFAEPGINFGA